MQSAIGRVEEGNVSRDGRRGGWVRISQTSDAWGTNTWLYNTSQVSLSKRLLLNCADRKAFSMAHQRLSHELLEQSRNRPIAAFKEVIFQVKSFYSRPSNWRVSNPIESRRLANHPRTKLTLC